MLGSWEVCVKYKGQVARLPLLVVKGEGSSLFGRNWLKSLRLDWPSIFQVSNGQLQHLLHQYSAVFESGLGTLKGFTAKISIEPNARPRFCKARFIPYDLWEKIEEEFQRLVAMGILEPAEYAEWASPIVSVLRSDKKTVRICGDFIQTVNLVSKLDKYPIPKVEDLFAKKAFTKLDLSQAYQQLVLDNKSKEYTPRRVPFRYTRLPWYLFHPRDFSPCVWESTEQDPWSRWWNIFLWLEPQLKHIYRSWRRC